jgi:HD-GYP domain-containing protein (c-di-GMP phosphodiesterase class II)
MNRERATELAATLEESGYVNIVLDRIARQTCDVVGADGTCLVVRDRSDRPTAIAVAACGPDEELVGSRLESIEGLTGRAVRSGRPVTDDGRFKRSRAVAPVVWSGRVRGALRAELPHGPDMGPHELLLLSSFAEVAGAALAHTERRDELLSTMRERLCAFVVALDRRDGYTAGHSEEVVELCRGMGDCLGLAPPDMLELELGALLHDVGKLSLRAALLRKPGALDADEWEVIRCHPGWGAELISTVPGLEPVATIVRFHHERWDGDGYPVGLAGHRIPLASRIVAVCDAYHAMTSDRPYRSKLPQAEAIAELRAGAGSQFDPDLVKTFIQSLDLPADNREQALAPA